MIVHFLKLLQVSYKYLYFILDPIYILCICYLLFELMNKYCLN